MRPTPLPICINVSGIEPAELLLLSESGNKRGEQKYEGRESPLWQCEESLPTPKRGSASITADGARIAKTEPARPLLRRQQFGRCLLALVVEIEPARPLLRRQQFGRSLLALLGVLGLMAFKVYRVSKDLKVPKVRKRSIKP